MDVIKGPDSIREETLNRLMAEYEVPLLRMCAVYLRDAQLAEDAVQETFVKAYRHWDAFRKDCSEKTWLMRIAVNTCKDLRRQAWYRYVDRSIPLDSLPAPTAEPAYGQTELSLAVMKLPRKFLEVTMLYYYQGMTMKEIAEALKIPQRTVSSRLMRAREKLRALLEEEASYVSIG